MMGRGWTQWVRDLQRPLVGEGVVVRSNVPDGVFVRQWGRGQWARGLPRSLVGEGVEVSGGVGCCRGGARSMGKRELVFGVWCFSYDPELSLI